MINGDGGNHIGIATACTGATSRWWSSTTVSHLMCQDAHDKACNALLSEAAKGKHAATIKQHAMQSCIIMSFEVGQDAAVMIRQRWCNNSHSTGGSGFTAQTSDIHLNIKLNKAHQQKLCLELPFKYAWVSCNYSCYQSNCQQHQASQYHTWPLAV